MGESESYAKGMEMRRTLYGEARAGTNTEPKPAMQAFGDWVRSAVLGDLWQRGGIDLKTRILICIATDVAMGVTDELLLHIKMGLRHGWTETELTEAIIHAGGYSGVPRGRHAIVIADRAYEEFRRETEGSAKSGA